MIATYLNESMKMRESTRAFLVMFLSKLPLNQRNAGNKDTCLSINRLSDELDACRKKGYPWWFSALNSKEGGTIFCIGGIKMNSYKGFRKVLFAYHTLQDKIWLISSSEEMINGDDEECMKRHHKEVYADMRKLARLNTVEEIVYFMRNLRLNGGTKL